RPTRGGKLACVSQTPRPTRQKISAQRENYFGLVEVIARVSCVCAERFVLMPFRTWVFRKETRDLIEKSWGRFTPRQQAQAGATACLPSRCGAREIAEEQIPRANLPFANHGLRALRIIERQQLGLHERVARAETRGMFRVPFDLGRSPFVRFDQNPAGISAKREGRRVVEWLSRDHFFRLPNIRNDVLRRLPRATSSARERDGSAHQLDKLPPA